MPLLPLGCNDLNAIEQSSFVLNRLVSEGFGRIYGIEASNLPKEEAKQPEIIDVNHNFKI